MKYNCTHGTLLNKQKEFDNKMFIFNKAFLLTYKYRSASSLLKKFQNKLPYSSCKKKKKKKKKKIRYRQLMLNLRFTGIVYQTSITIILKS